MDFRKEGTETETRKVSRKSTVLLLSHQVVPPRQPDTISDVF